MKQAKKIYVVNVGNIGNMEYTNKKLAIDCYKTYVTLSMNNETRAAGESVVLFCNDDIVMEYQGSTEMYYEMLDNQ